MQTSDWIIQSLQNQNVDTCFGVSGANIEDLFHAAQTAGLRVVLAKHEHGAGTMADGYARAGNRLGVALATSGGGALNLIPSLGEAYASRVPLLALLGQPPHVTRGQGAFQETSGEAGTFDLERVLAPLTKFCGRAQSSEDVPALLAQALEAALTHPRGPVVLLLPKDVQTGETNAAPTQIFIPAPEVAPHFDDFLNQAVPAHLGLILGEEVWKQGLGPQALALAERLNAQVAVTTEGRGSFPEAHAQFTGVIGVMGSEQTRARLADCDALWILGTRLGAMERYRLEPLLAGKTVYDFGPEAAFVRGRYIQVSLGSFFERALGRFAATERKTVAPSLTQIDSINPTETGSRLTLKNLAPSLQSLLGAPQTQLVIDAGNAVAALAQGLKLGDGARWMIALGMGGMGYSFGAAIGAHLATGRPVTVFAGDGAFLMHGLEMHTAIELGFPICFILADNRGHGMCETREELFFETPGGLNRFKEIGLAAGLAKLFPSLPVFEAATVEAVRDASAAIPLVPGPKALVLRLPPGEMPPFAPFQDLMNLKVKNT